jgi:hypothetical protein
MSCDAENSWNLLFSSCYSFISSFLKVPQYKFGMTQAFHLIFYFVDTAVGVCYFIAFGEDYSTLFLYNV